MIDRLREERLRGEERQHFLSRVLEASPSGVVTFDLDGRVASVNPRAAALLSTSDGGGAEALAGRRLEELPSPFARALAGLRTGETRVLPLRGSRRLKCQRGEFLDRGFPRPFLVLEELTEELRQSEKAAYEKLIRMMSHEVNNSLGAARSLLESCLSYGERLSGEERADFEGAIAVVVARTDRLVAFMRDFAEVVRIPPPKKRPLDAGAVLAGVVSLLSAEAARRGAAVRVALEEPLDGIEADRSQLEQVFVNVLKNAMEAAGPGGSVTVRSGRVGGRRTLSIEDSGPGVAADARVQLFRPFFSTKENGRGIGLTVVQEILRGHGFEFALEVKPAEAAGPPTRFVLVF